MDTTTSGACSLPVKFLVELELEDETLFVRQIISVMSEDDAAINSGVMIRTKFQLTLSSVTDGRLKYKERKKES